MKSSYSDRVHPSHLLRGGSVGHLCFIGISLRALTLPFVFTCRTGGHACFGRQIQATFTKKDVR